MEKSPATEINWITKTVASTEEAIMTRVPYSWGSYFFKQRKKQNKRCGSQKTKQPHGEFSVGVVSSQHRKR